MTKSSKEWKESARKTIDSTFEDLHNDVLIQTGRVEDTAYEFRSEMLVDEPDTDEVRKSATELVKELKELGYASFDAASDVSALREWPITRGLEGEEPLGYSKRDAGATHDAYYGAQAQNRMFAREVAWPLDLADEVWQVERGEPRRKGFDPVTAEGSKKYTRRLGGRVVSVVVDERGMSPI